MSHENFLKDVDTELCYNLLNKVTSFAPEHWVDEHSNVNFPEKAGRFVTNPSFNPAVNESCGGERLNEPWPCCRSAH